MCAYVYRGNQGYAEEELNVPITRNGKFSKFRPTFCAPGPDQIKPLCVLYVFDCTVCVQSVCTLFGTHLRVCVTCDAGRYL